MSDKITNGPTPESFTKPRKTGSHLVPERATPRYTGKQRGQYPKGSIPAPERTKGVSSGSSQENTQPHIVVPPIATREGGGEGKPAGSRKNPFPVKGHGKSRI